MNKLIIAFVLLVVVVVPLAVMKFGDSKKEEYKQVAYLANGLSIASTLKTYVVGYYSERGRYPESNSVIGLPDPETFSGEGVRSVEVRDGVVIITYTDLTGIEGGTIRLRPVVERTGHMMKWRCETGTYNNIKEYMPQCDYVSM